MHAAAPAKYLTDAQSSALTEAEATAAEVRSRIRPHAVQRTVSVEAQQIAPPTSMAASAALLLLGMLLPMVAGFGSDDANVCDVRAQRWKAAGDNATDDTLTIQAAIDDCHRDHPLGAVVLLSGPATYRVTASLALTSNLTLRLEAQTSLFSAVTPYMPVQQNPRCSTTSWPHGPTAVLCGTNLSNVAVVGADMNTSVLDGGGWPWYNYTSVVGGGLGGPRLFEPVWSSNVTLAHLTLQWSAGWTVHPTFCSGVLAHHIYIHNPRPVGNTDGFDPDSCTDVVLHDSIIDTGDDGISIKSGNSTACKTCGHIQMPAKNIHIYRLLSHLNH